MRNLDFSSWQGVISTLFGLAVITLIGVGIRLLVMQTIQQRRERENRQINERLRTLIAAYKILGGSFTGNLAVDPTHLRDLRYRNQAFTELEASETSDPAPASVEAAPISENAGSDRPRRVRDAVEAALSDIILLGTEEQVRLAATAAAELVAGRPIHTAELVVSLRDFIRAVLTLDPVPAHVSIPAQGPARPSGTRAKSESGNRAAGAAGKQGGGQGMGMGGGGVSGGMGLGGGLSPEDDTHHQR